MGDNATYEELQAYKSPPSQTHNPLASIPKTDIITTMKNKKSVRYAYPAYDLILTNKMLDECLEIGLRLLHEVGLTVKHANFLSAIRNRPGVKIDGDRVLLDESLVRENIAEFVSRKREELQQAQNRTDKEWTVIGGGTSLMVIDPETDAARPASSQDLKDLCRLINSYQMQSTYPVIPQDVPPSMQGLAVFKIVWENSDRIRCVDYTDKQVRYLYEMHKVMNKPLRVLLNLVGSMRLSEDDLDVFLNLYPDWQRHKDIYFTIQNYGMPGINKPVTVTGCIAEYIAETFGVFTLLKLFDPELDVRADIGCGHPTDLRNICWAFGHPRYHLYAYLQSQIYPLLCNVKINDYCPPVARLESGACTVDAQAALEKMGTAMIAALQGARRFVGAGNLAVDDLFSGVQLVIDMEIVNYIREAIEAFAPHRDIVSMDNLYEVLHAVNAGDDLFISHPDTVGKFRNILPSSDFCVREKLRSWLSHGKTLKDRAREECLRRIRNKDREFHLPADKQKALDDIYKRAEVALLK